MRASFAVSLFVAAFANVAVGQGLGEAGTIVLPPTGMASVPTDVLVIPPGAIQSAPALESDSVVTLGELANETAGQPNGLIEPVGYQCPTDGTCQTPYGMARQAVFSGWSFRTEAMLLSPSFAGGNVTLTDDDENGAGGPRFTFGYETRRGGGVEFRFGGITFDDAEYSLIDNPSVRGPWEMETFQFDTDVYQRLWVGQTSVVLGAGLRVASLEVDDNVGRAVIETAGLGFGAGLNRPFWQGESNRLAWISHARASIMAGDAGVTTDTRYADATLTITELALGIEWRNWNEYSNLVGNVQFELQRWDSNLIQPVVLDGLTLGIGCQW